MSLSSSRRANIFRGIFGINPQPLNFSTLGNFSSPSFVSTLKAKEIIPSLSWSYTAGAIYREYLDSNSWSSFSRGCFLTDTVLRAQKGLRPTDIVWLRLITVY